MGIQISETCKGTPTVKSEETATVKALWTLEINIYKALWTVAGGENVFRRNFWKETSVIRIERIGEGMFQTEEILERMRSRLWRLYEINYTVENCDTGIDILTYHSVKRLRNKFPLKISNGLDNSKTKWL